MAEYLGDPKHPCAGMQRSKSMLSLIEREARANVDSGRANETDVEEGIRDLRHQTIQDLGMVCSELCPLKQLCMLDSFGSNDPLLRIQNLTGNQQRELRAKSHFDLLSSLSEMSIGIFLG